jgi:hypothetical protein
MKLKHFNEIMTLMVIFSIHFQQVTSLCNVYPKIFGDQTDNIELRDLEIHEGTDTIVSVGRITHSLASYTLPILIVSSLSTTKVKWAVTVQLYN